LFLRIDVPGGKQARNQAVAGSSRSNH